MNNPLSSIRPPAQGAGAQHPAQAHAQIWGQVQKIPQGDLEAGISSSSYGVPILGALASNPKTTRKDVIKAAADAAGEGKIPASEAVSLISEMPDDPDKLQPWLKQLYATHLTALVHMKARAMPDQQPGVMPQ